MAIFKCKMCGGTLEINADVTVAECEYCGSKQTIPSKKDEIVTNLFNRANNLRIKNEFDKAAEVYNKILNENDSEAEAHWGLVLCKYGIEYVEDPKTYKRIPTCHRTQYVSVLSDADYLAAIENADAVSRELYVAQAHEIAELQKSILAIVKDEKPFDVFICYKETDESGKRTIDSTIANDIYYQLTKEGLRVFYSAITLEDKLGVEYEPYIFAALNSAKVMLVIGTRPEYFNAVWVKNEWSRYLAIMKNDREKLLIPCYRDMDAYDLPEEFAHLQAQDMSKIGFINDVVRGIGKVVVKDEPKKETVVKEVVKETVTSSATSANPAPLLKRAFMFLEDSDWHSADEYAEKVLDIDPECAEGYLVKLMTELKVTKREKLKDCSVPFNNSGNYTKAVRFGSKELKAELEGYINHINKRVKLETERQGLERLTRLYNEATALKTKAKTETEFKRAARKFEEILNFKDAERQKAVCLEIAEKRAKKRKKNISIFSSVIAVVIVVVVVLKTVIIPGNDYKKAVALMDEGNYSEAIVAFTLLRDYKDSTEKIKECQEAMYNEAMCLIDEGKVAEAAIAFSKCNYYKDSREKSYELWDKIAVRETVSAEEFHTVGLKSDGTVVAVGYNVWGQCDVEGWTDIVAVSAGISHTIGIKSDGTVIAVGNNNDGRCDVEGWMDIIAVSAGSFHTVGLKSDGTVVAVGDNNYSQCNTETWTDIVAVSAGDFHTVGLKSDGTVVAVGNNVNGQNNTENWTNIVAVSTSGSHTVGLKSDGTVVAVGNNDYGQCDVEAWTDIVAISVDTYYTIGLKSDGTVVAVGDNDDGQCDVEGWTDIVAVSAGGSHTVGLKSDGTVVATEYTGDLYKGQCDVEDWKNIRLP